MGIIIVNKFLYPNGGSETYIFKLGEELKRRGHDVQYFGMEHKGRVAGNDAGIYTSGMDFHTGKLQKLLYPLKIIYSHEAYKKMYALMDKVRPDVVHLNNFNFQLTPSVIFAARDWEKKNGHKVRIIYTAHDYQWVCPNHMMLIPGKNAPCFKCEGGHFGRCAVNKCIHGSAIKSLLGTIEAKYQLSKRAYDLVDTIICPSEFLKNKLETYPLWSGKDTSRKGAHPHIIMMHNFLTEMPDDRSGLNVDGSNESANTVKEDYVLYFGRYSAEKGVKTLLKVCRELPEIEFKFAGDGPLRPDVESVDNVTNLGFLQGEDLFDTIRRSRLVVFPSEWYENCPYSVMESVSCGTPVLASDIGGVPELLKNGVTGELFKPGNKDDLKSHIKDMLSDKDRLNRYAQNCLKEEYPSVSDYVDELCDLLNMDSERT